MTDSCPFCQIVAGDAPRSIVYEDDGILAFLDIAPLNTGQCVIIPKQHIDHFTDLPDDIAARIMVVAQHIGRKQRDLQDPHPRIGHIVHGFGVLHAHLVVIPQYSKDDIKPGKSPARPPRPELDALAKSLRIFLKIGANKNNGRRLGDKPVKPKRIKLPKPPKGPKPRKEKKMREKKFKAPKR